MGWCCKFLIGESGEAMAANALWYTSSSENESNNSNIFGYSYNRVIG